MKWCFFYIVAALPCVLQAMVGRYERILEFARYQNMPAVLFFHFKDTKRPVCLQTQPLQNIFLFVDVSMDNVVNLRLLEESHRLKERFHVGHLPALVLVAPEGEVVRAFPFQDLSPKLLTKSLFSIWRDWATIQCCLQEPTRSALSLYELKTLYETAVERGFTEFRARLLECGLEKDSGTYFLLERYTELVSNGLQSSAEAKRIQEKIIEKTQKKAG